MELLINIVCFFPTFFQSSFILIQYYVADVTKAEYNNIHISFNSTVEHGAFWFIPPRWVLDPFSWMLERFIKCEYFLYTINITCKVKHK